MFKGIRRIKLTNISYYTTKSKRSILLQDISVDPVKIHHQQEHNPFLITCKNSKFDLKLNQVHRNKNEIIKFGTIPLASNGWKHHKSKGDFFILHPYKSSEENLLKHYLTELSPNINEKIVENLKSEFEINQLTDVQIDSIRNIMDFNHVLIAAETGCGKTLAYLIPIVQQILEKKLKLPKRDLNTPLGLIITPGRELAIQIGEIVTKLIQGTDINVETVVGGKTKQKMINPEFKDMDILVGTIGALSKLVTTGVYRTNHIRHVVLDEADTLFDDSFSDKLCHFLKKFPFYRNHLIDTSPNVHGSQLILASATMPRNIKELLQNVINTETINEVVSANLHRLLPNIQQKFLRTNKSDRPSKLLALVKSDIKKKKPVIIFGNKSATSDFISIFLNDSGVNCISLNGDMLMQIRQGRFEQFQDGHVDVLSTTDVASRGLDTTRAYHIINFDFPYHIADYIHRSGRIGRLGTYQNCTITNFVSSQAEVPTVQKIEHAARTGTILPNVNANITNIIHNRIIKQIEDTEKIF